MGPVRRDGPRAAPLRRPRGSVPRGGTHSPGQASGRHHPPAGALTAARLTMPPAPLWLLDHADIMGGGQLFALRLARFLRADQPERGLVIVCPRETELAARCEAEAIEPRHAEFPALVPSPGLAAGVRALRRLLDEVP